MTVDVVLLSNLIAQLFPPAMSDNVQIYLIYSLDVLIRHAKIVRGVEWFPIHRLHYIS